MAVSAQKKRLGRSLASLIGDDIAAVPGVADQRSVPLSSLRASRFNPRRNFSESQLAELAASISERGLVQPLVVRPLGGSGDRYEIVAGERRWRAAQQADLHEVPVVIRALSDQEAIEIAIIENVQREDLNSIEEGEGYHLLMQGHGYTQEDLAKVIGVLDWEMSTIGDPLMDLGVTLGYWVNPDEGGGFSSSNCFLADEPGSITRVEFADRYAEQMGKDIPNLHFYYVFALIKLAVVVQQIYYRYKQGLTSDERFAGLIFAVEMLGQRSAQVIESEKI